MGSVSFDTFPKVLSFQVKNVNKSAETIAHKSKLQIRKDLFLSIGFLDINLPEHWKHTQDV